MHRQGNGTHSNILAWRIPWTEEPGGLQYMGSQRVRHDWVTLLTYLLTLPTKVCLVKAMVFPVVMYGCESWTVKKAKCQRIDAFELWYWRRFLRVPWTEKRYNQSILKEISPEYSLEGLMLKQKLQHFGHLMQRADSLRIYGLQHAGIPCQSPTPGACSDSCPSGWWCHPTISPSVVSFSSWLQSFPASGSFPKSQFFASVVQSIGVSASASILPMNIQDWFPWGLTGWISLLSKGHSRVFSNTTVQKHQFFSA